ncbi:MAG: AmmeMemoRadiSam system protein B [Candidatus Lokiarchaeota archaeon]
MTTRKSAVAGSFYPRYKPDLIRVLKNSFLDEKFGPGKLPECENKEERTIIGGVSPHAGYTYSGSVAAFTYLNLFKEKVPETVVILGTDHQGYGSIALMREGRWETPLGDLEIDNILADEILNGSNLIKNDDSAFVGFPHGREHNIEVQLPFIKFCAGNKSVKILPIKISNFSYKTINTLALDLSKTIESIDKDIVIVASSDMTHKQPRNIQNPKEDIQDMQDKDQAVINAFLDLNPEKTFNSARETTVCGPQTITSLLVSCKELGGKKAKKLQYYTSYEKGGGTGPCEYSVGYFSGIILK